MTGIPAKARQRRQCKAIPAALTLVAFCNVSAMAQEPFRIGLIAQPGEEAQVEGLSGIKAAFASALERPVEVFVARDYAILAQAQIDGRIDYAAYSATAYAAAMLRCNCLVPLAAPLDSDGAPGLYSVLIIRSNSAGAAGRLAVGPDDSLATRLAPLAASVAAQTAAIEGRLVEAKTATQAQTMFLNGDVDGFFSWVPALDKKGGDSEALDEQILSRFSALETEIPAWQIAWRSALLPYGPHAVRNDLPAMQAKKLARLLTDDSSFDARMMPGYGGGLTPIHAADYKAVEEALGKLEHK